MAGLVPLLLALGTATVTTAYYQIHGPVLHTLILLSVLWLLLPAWRKRAPAPGRATLGVSAIFLIYALVAVLSAARVGFNTNALDGLEHFSYFLAGAVLIPFLIALRPRPLWFWAAIAATALLSGLYALWEMHAFGDAYRLATGLEYRAAGSKGKRIPFGDIAAVASVLSLLGACVYFGVRRPWFWFFSLAALAGLYASLASGTRGAWVFFPTGLVIIGFYLGQRYPARRRGVLLGLLGMVLVGGVALSRFEPIHERITTAVTELRGYVPGQGVQPGNALGERFEMWRGAWMAFQSHPVLGIGVGQLNGYFKQAAEQGRISSAVALFNGGEGHTHAHNDYLNALATRGLLGLISLLLLYLGSLAVFVRATLVGQDEAQRGLGYAGILCVLAYMQFSLTDSILVARITAGYFVLLCGWLLAMNLSVRDQGT